MFGKCLGTFMFHMQQMKTLQGWVVVVFTYDQNCQKVGRNGNCQNNCLQKIHVLHPWRLTWNTKMAVDGNLFSWFLGSVLIFQGVNGKGLFHGPFNNYTFFIISSALLQLNLFWGTAREYNFNSKQPTNFPPPGRHANIPFPAPNLSFRHLMRTVGLGDYREVVGQHQLAAMIQRHFLLVKFQRWDGDRPVGQRGNTRSKSRYAAWWRVGSIWDSCPLEDSINHENI